MMQSLVTIVLLGLSVTQGAAVATIVGMNASQFRGRCKNPQGPSYGKNSCRCVGIDNLKGYYAAQVAFHHVQYLAETGASCGAWDKTTHPSCKDETVAPQWCSQEWCYVDPCSCDLDVLPKQSEAGIEFEGSPAYWSYATCGGMDFFSEEIEGACVNQKTQGDCVKQGKCAWNGKQCAGKEIVETCKDLSKKDESVHGEEDCRCVGLGGKDVGKAFMNINADTMVQYPANVGATCEAWESTAHPDCLKDGDKPAWCSAKWCFVDPCKCKNKAKIPPKEVMEANRYMRFQGKTAYWSYATCGSEDSWSADMKDSYCHTQESEAECAKMDKCQWNGKDCLTKVLADICAKQEETGVLGTMTPMAESAAVSTMPAKVLLAMLGTIVMTKGM